MRKHFHVVTVLVSLVLLAGGIFAQGEPNAVPVESSFEVTLTLIAGSNDSSQKGELPATFSPIARQLRSTFGFNNLRIVDTYVGRIGNSGGMSYKSLANFDGNTQSSTPSFLDWQITGLRNATGTSANTVFINAFRFGARVPVTIGPSASNAPVQYENIGVTVDRLTAVINSPVLIGTVGLAKADGGRVFLVLNITPVAN